MSAKEMQKPETLRKLLKEFTELPVELRTHIDYDRADLKFAWSNSDPIICQGYTDGQMAFSDGVQIGAILAVKLIKKLGKIP